MRRELVLRPAAVDARTAMWIRANVLSRTPSARPGRKWDGPDFGEAPFVLIDWCPCQWGPCGNCQELGKHDDCAHRKGTAPRSDGHETYVISARRGSALTRVWVKQVFDGQWKGCQWVCPCEVCEQIGRPLIPQQYTDSLPRPKRIVGPLSAQRPLF